MPSLYTSTNQERNTSHESWVFVIDLSTFIQCHFAGMVCLHAHTSKPMAPGPNHQVNGSHSHVLQTSPHHLIPCNQLSIHHPSILQVSVHAYISCCCSPCNSSRKLALMIQSKAVALCSTLLVAMLYTAMLVPRCALC